MSFLRALGTGQQQHALSAVVYAYAFLFPENTQQRPSGFDPRLRTACDIYNRSLTRAFASADHSRIDLHTGRYGLSFGSIDVTFDPAGARWGDQLLSNFTPADELRIHGLKIRYRRPGIGASLAASLSEGGKCSTGEVACPGSGWRSMSGARVARSASVVLRPDVGLWYYSRKMGGGR